MSFQLVFLLSLSLACAARADDGELIPANEGTEIARTLKLLARPPTAPRGKIHGCLNGQFSIFNSWDKNLSQGLFAGESRSYYADIRFEDASVRRVDDVSDDALGVSIKIYGVTGEKLLEGSERSNVQDFVLASAPTFFAANVAQFLERELAERGQGLGALNLLNLSRSHEMPINNPLRARYWSRTPSKFGNTQAKFMLVNCVGSQFKGDSLGSDRLRENLTATMADGPACFDFKAQLRSKPDKQPIEDASVEWLPQDSPFQNVARIWIRPQAVDTGETCNRLQFSSWNGLRAHRPLGGIARLRKAIAESLNLP